MRIFALGLAALLLGGCGTLSPKDGLLAGAVAGVAADARYLTMPILASAAVVYLVMDPFAPNWTIEEAQPAEGRYQLALRLKGLHSGGDGEAHQVFVRRAAQLAAQPGYRGYEVTGWQEGVESSRPFAQRVAFGEIRLLAATALNGEK